MSLRTIVIIALITVFAVSFIEAPYYEHQFLQHGITIASLITFLIVDSRHRFSDTSFILIGVFFALHILGARYIYSYVPYDEWSEQLFGISITSAFHFTRNHYDRFVHFMYGLLLTYPIYENFRKRGMKDRTALWGSLMFIVTTGTLYEIGEWGVALYFSPQDAEAYNGQQGDFFDAQKDMALAFLGSLIVCCIIRVVRKKK
jgi:putative membrane protein